MMSAFIEQILCRGEPPCHHHSCKGSVYRAKAVPGPPLHDSTSGARHWQFDIGSSTFDTSSSPASRLQENQRTLFTEVFVTAQAASYKTNMATVVGHLQMQPGMIPSQLVRVTGSPQKRIIRGV